MRNLPLFYYPGTWIYVDDDKTLLNCMALEFVAQGNYKLFSTPNDCLDFIKNYVAPSSQQHFLSSNRDDEKYGILQHTSIDFDLTKVAEFANLPERHNEITAMVIDYHMPVMDGFTLSKACEKLPVNKILLTGAAEEEEIISGFNQNYIQLYIQKGVKNLEEKLIVQLKKLTYAYFQKITAPLLSHLEVEHLLPLSDPIFIDFFIDYCAQKNIREYYLMDKQGSFLCIDDQGKHSYLVVHTDRSIDSWLAMYFTGKELPSELADSIRAYEKMPFFGLGKEAWHLDPTEWKNCFYDAKRIQGRENYYWFEIEA